MKCTALLRGINLGAHNRVSMADLKALLGRCGYTDVTTILQSGNATFTVAGRRSASSIAADIQAAIAVELGLDVPVHVRTGAELGRIVAANPLPAAEAEPAKLNVVFLDARIASIEALEPESFTHEDIRLGDRVLYVWYHHGVGQSKLLPAVMERRLGVGTTTRNWNTVTKLAELTSA